MSTEQSNEVITFSKDQLRSIIQHVIDRPQDVIDYMENEDTEHNSETFLTDALDSLEIIPNRFENIDPYVIGDYLFKNGQEEYAQAFYTIVDAANKKYPSPLQGVEGSHAQKLKDLIIVVLKNNRTDLFDEEGNSEPAIPESEFEYVADEFVNNLPDVEGVEEAAVKSAEDVLAKRISVFPSDGNMTDKSIKRNVIAAMHEYTSQFQDRSKGVGMYTREQMEACFTAGKMREWTEQFGHVPWKHPDKESYINSITL